MLYICKTEMQTQVRCEAEAIPMKSATFKLAAEQAEWLKKQSQASGESQNTIVRSLLRMAMQGQIQLTATIKAGTRTVN